MLNKISTSYILWVDLIVYTTTVGGFRYFLLYNFYRLILIMLEAYLGELFVDIQIESHQFISICFATEYSTQFFSKTAAYELRHIVNPCTVKHKLNVRY